MEQKLAITVSDLPNLQNFATGDIPTILANIINWFLWAAGALAVIYLIYSGIMYITSAGNAEKATAGENGVVYAIIGIVIILLSFVIVNWVQNILE